MFAIMSHLEVKRINIIREEGSKYQQNYFFAFMSYLEVKSINIIREEGSKNQPVIVLPFQYYIDNRHTAGDFSDKSISNDI